jgi:hypothetical protein
MRGGNGIWPLMAILALLAGGLVGIWGLLQAQAGDWLVPSPEDTAAGFVAALGAGRWHGAYNQLSSQLSESVSEEDLRQWTEVVEASKGKIDQAVGIDSTEQGDSAAAEVQVQYDSGEQETWSFELIRENQLWKVNALP